MIATVVVGCVVELLNYLNIYQGLGAYLLNIIAVMGVAFIIVSLAAAAMQLMLESLDRWMVWAERKMAGNARAERS